MDYCGSESAENNVGPALEVGPTEDVIQALMETLVDPLLPLSVSKDPPSQDDQESVAKQMHAVVVLYNYYHRKQKPELKFLGFAPFCKLAVVMKPPLVSFMKLTTESDESMNSNISEDQLSVTEKAVKYACDIALALDASKNSINTDGWPISKVAVLLIDSNKENCMLRFGDVTKGVWSLFEKELNERGVKREMLAEEKTGDKRKRNNLKRSTYENELLQLGYDVVKDVAGIDRSELEVLRTHVAYSLSKEKSAARVFMMRFSGTFSRNNEVSLKELVESLQGPLAEKVDFGFWKTTPVVEFYHLLPYVDFISRWLSGDDSYTPTSNEDIFQSTPKDGNESDGTNIDSAENKKNRVILDTSDIILVKTEIDENLIQKSTNKHDVAHSDKSDKIRKCEILDTDGGERDKDFSSAPSSGVKTMMNVIDSTNACVKSDTSSKSSSELRVYHHRRKNISSMCTDTHAQEDGGDLKVNMADSLKSNHTESKGENVVAEDKGDVKILCKDDNIASTRNQVVLFEVKNEDNLEVQIPSASQELKIALSLLYSKREELYGQISGMEAALASCENDIASIRDGGDVDLARECTESIISSNYDPLLNIGEKKTGESDIYLPGKSSWQDLEYISFMNNWSLPRCHVFASDGKFIANVTVQGKHFELQSKGGFESNPCEARESAAAEMIDKIKNI